MLDRGRPPSLAESLHARRIQRPRSVWRRALGAAGALIVLTVLVLFLGLLVAPRKPHPHGARSAGGMDRVLQQALLDLEQARRSAASGPAAAVRLTLNDADVDDYLAQTFPGRAWPLGLRDPALAFDTGKVSLSARVSLVGLPLRLTTELEPVARQGRVAITAPRLRLGLLPVPGRYRQRLASEVQSAVNSVLYATGMRLEALEIRSGKVTVTLRPAVQ